MPGTRSSRRPGERARAPPRPPGSSSPASGTLQECRPGPRRTAPRTAAPAHVARSRAGRRAPADPDCSTAVSGARGFLAGIHLGGRHDPCAPG